VIGQRTFGVRGVEMRRRWWWLEVDFVVEVMVGGGWECDTMAEVVAANDEGCGCVVEVEGWH
jgi:hypothetical protein